TRPATVQPDHRRHATAAAAPSAAQANGPDSRTGAIVHRSVHYSAQASARLGAPQREGGSMKVGTEQEWQEARKELLAVEREFEQHAERVAEQRRALPWVPVETEYTFATNEGSRTLAELFGGRSQLLVYHLMFGEDWAAACPG